MRRLSVVMLALLLFVGGDSFARRGSGGIRRSPSRSISRPRAKKAPARKPSSSLTKKSAAKKATVAKKPKAVARSKTDKAMAKKNNLAAKKHGSRANAQKSFKEGMKKDPSFAKNYPNKFAKQPAQRPGHIPGNVNRGGVSHNVTYMNGGYGYMGPLGTWMMLDMMTDIMITDAMLRNRGYGTYGAGGAPMTVRTDPSGALVFLMIAGGVVGVVVVVKVISSVVA